ncbi:MAG TPA: hypothetical protein VEL28_23060 [Candidatus Binatia bacterium]|nr:hypothetical protein [Candidatus Binatia bacterium]
MRIPSSYAALVCTACLSLPGAAFSAVPDQSFECIEYAPTGSVPYTGPTGQSFKPAQATLTGVEMWLEVGAGQAGNATINLRAGATVAGPVLATVTRLVGVGSAQWVHFEFASPVTVVPEDTYTIELDTTTQIEFYYNSTYCGDYDRGTAIRPSVSIGDHDIVFRTFGPCGNGAVEDEEDCDDEIFASDGCCMRTCAFRATGTTCASDSTDLCARHQCSASGVCDDVMVPATTCSTAEKASLLLINADSPDKDKVNFKWSKGPVAYATIAELIGAGQPLVLCVYDGSGIIARSELPAGVLWTHRIKGEKSYFTFADKYGQTGGITSAVIQYVLPDAEPVSSTSLQAGGPYLTGLAMNAPLTGEVTAQMVTGDGGCWGVSFSEDSIKKNTGEKFKGSIK